MNVVRVKDGVQFTVIAPGGFCILAAIQRAAIMCIVDLTITSACDGVHSGPTDPHHRGEAYDIRTHDMSPGQKSDVLGEITRTLGERFYGFLEAPGTPNEHLHVQVARGTAYP